MSSQVVPQILGIELAWKENMLSVVSVVSVVDPWRTGCCDRNCARSASEILA
jgi:hypothetical protein